MLRIGIVTGEPSGDMLGAGLIGELNKRVENLSIEGIGGEKLAKKNMNILFPMEKLSVMGFTEVFGKYFELKRIRGKLIKHFLRIVKRKNTDFYITNKSIIDDII